MNDSAPPDNLPIEAYSEGGIPPMPVPSPGQTAIQTTGAGSMARRIADPRDLARVMNNIKIMAGAAGTDWYYRWPVKNKDGTKSFVEGPSIKCASAVARMYGNCEVTCVVKESMTHHIFEATFVDLETGFCLTRPFQQRRSQNLGTGMDKERQADIVFQIGVSKATRNVVNNALETFTDFAKEEAKKSLVEKIGKNLDGNRKRVVELLAENKIDLKRVEFIYAKPWTEWLATDMAKMYAEIKAISDGMANPDETYPPTKAETDAHLASTAGIPGAHLETAGTGAGHTATVEATVEETDWDSMVSELIGGLNNCKSAGEVTKFIDENQPAIELISKSPPEINQRWTTALTKRMKELKPPADKK